MSSPDGEYVDSKYIHDNYGKIMRDLLNNPAENTEFEIDLNMDKISISYVKYMEILKYFSLSKNRDKFKVITSTTLDISCNEMAGDIRRTHRITLNNIEIINKYAEILWGRRNHVVFDTIRKVAMSGDVTGIILNEKTKSKRMTHDISNLNTRIRVSTETPIMPKNIMDVGDKQVSLRYKNRISLIVEETDSYIIEMDLTAVKNLPEISRINDTQPNYELELECFIKNKKINLPDVLNKIIERYVLLLKVVQQSNYPITLTTSDNVLKSYRTLMSVTEKSKRLDGRQPVSIEVQHATDILPSNYAVTDKADGDRYFTIILGRVVYLISQYMNVKDTGIRLKNSDHNNTIFDCEYVYASKFNKYMIMVFDCLFSDGEDIRKNPLLLERLGAAQKIINDCLILPNNRGYTLPKFTERNTIENYEKFYTRELTEYHKNFLHDLEQLGHYPLIRVKFFIPVFGLSHNEIFKYSTIIWNKYMYDNIKYPYLLDGLIYQPLIQPYITKTKDSKFADYKWKPPEKNTIDFYIEFEKDPKTGKLYTVYDNTDQKYGINKPYRICNLYNGREIMDPSHSTHKEIPVQFGENGVVNLFIENGQIRDRNGDIIQDNTVVEFYYNTNVQLDDKCRWTPLRTRYDKTEMVNKYKVRYGNSLDVAQRIWHSIQIPVKFSDISTLANDAVYHKHLNAMRAKVLDESIKIHVKEGAYYQIETRLAKPMRDFHNWVKSMLIFTYCGSEYSSMSQTDDIKKYVLDVGCGRGGDIQKFYRAKIDSAVCLDPDYETLHSIKGAINQYKKAKRNYDAFPSMSIICADFTSTLDVNGQQNVIQDNSPVNLGMIAKFFPNTGMKTFDVINCQFAFHYFLANETAWKNVCFNINKCLKPGGYLILTTFDADRVIEMLADNNKYSIYYNNEKGEKKVLMDIIKKFSDDRDRGVGMAIDVYNSLISLEGTYITEYLVDKRFLIQELSKKCNLQIIDTCMFDTLFEISRDNIIAHSQCDENVETRSYLKKVSAFFDQSNELNASCFRLSRLNRYYVFRRIE